MRYHVPVDGRILTCSLKQIQVLTTKNKCMKNYLSKDFFDSTKQLIRKMKTTCLMLMVFVSSLFATNVNSQVAKVSILIRNATVLQVIRQIESQTDYLFVYDKNEIDVTRKVDISAEKKSVADILSFIFSNSNVIYAMEGSNIMLMIKSDTGQQKSVSGKVTDSSGASLPGVSVVVKGTTTGTLTDPNGNYSISNIPANATLQFSFVGMKMQEIAIGNKTNINVVLTEEAIGIEEVVAVGYGMQKKVNLTGAVSEVKGDELAHRASTGSIDALQGIVPGATIARSSGSPGQEGFDIQIRGLTSVNNNPVLVLVDGVEGNIEDVRPEDIESVSVLKDAAAAAIYGAKAAGGVILISTKKGKLGEVKIEYNSYFSLSKIARMPKRLDAYNQAIMKNLSLTNTGTSPAVGQDVLDKLANPNRTLNEIDPANPNKWIYYGNYDYEDLILKDFAPQQSHNIAIVGGSDNTTYRLSGTYYRNDGIIKIGYDKNERYTGRLSLDTKIGKYIKLSNIFSYSRNLVEKPGGRGIEGQWELLTEVFTRSGITPLYDPNGNWVIGGYLGTWDTRHKFAQWSYDAGIDKDDQNNLRINSTLTIDKLVDGLQFRIVGVTDNDFDNSFLNQKTIYEYGVNGSQTGIIYNGSRVYKDNSKATYKELQFLTDYDLKMGLNSLHFLGGYSLQDYRMESFSGTGNDLVNGNLPDFDWASATNISLKDFVRTNAFQSVFGRINYVFNDRYLFEGNLRYDGSSKLSPQNRYHLFPSFSVGWRVNEEKWFNIGFVNQLKLRGSWGQLGNAGVLGNYDYLPNLSIKDDLILSASEKRSQYILQNTLASKSISWETVETSNVGIDLGILESRLSVSSEFFVKRNKNMLAKVTYPSVIGVGVPNLNVGELKTWGWEVNATWKDNIGKINYWVNANIFDAQNELMEYLGADVISEGTVKLLNDYPVNSIFAYKTDGLFQSQEEVNSHAFQANQTGAGDVRYLDLNNDGRISAGKQTVSDHGDLEFMGSQNPRYNFGLQGGFTWKNLDFLIFFQGVGKRVFLMDQFSMMPFFNPAINPQRQHLDYWTEDNRDAFWPRPYNKGTHNFRPSDKWLQDAAYIRLKDLQIGYTIPRPVIEKAGIEKLRVYLEGRDLWEITKTFDYIDPESPSGATFVYPFRRKLTVGVNLIF